jgi:hypothetical protein
MDSLQPWQNQTDERLDRAFRFRHCGHGRNTVSEMCDQSFGQSPLNLIPKTSSPTLLTKPQDHNILSLCKPLDWSLVHKQKDTGR